MSIKSNLIPKSFKLGGKEYTVKEDNTIDYDHGWSGLHDANTLEIKLASKLGAAKMHIDSIEQTFYHELVHAILSSLHKYDLNKDEEFVDTFGTMLHQFMKTKK